MERIPEPEIMDEEEQACAYSMAQFDEPHSLFVSLFRRSFPGEEPPTVLDLGCGPADVTVRFARAFPGSFIDGIDASGSMLRYGCEMVKRNRMERNIRLIAGRIPEARLPLERYHAVISNSLLHHLPDPMILWRTIRSCSGMGTLVFVMDLSRPGSPEEAREIMERHSGNEPEILKRDFLNSLLASYRPDEVREQIESAGFRHLSVESVSDRHFIVFGRLEK